MTAGFRTLHHQDIDAGGHLAYDPAHLAHNPGRPISWVGTSVVIVGFTIGGIAFPISNPGPNWVLFWVGAAVAIVGCFAGDDEAHRHCVIQPHCRLKGVFAAARDAFLAELDKHTVGELAEPASELATLLGIVRFVPPAGSGLRRLIDLTFFCAGARPSTRPRQSSWDQARLAAGRA